MNNIIIIIILKITFSEGFDTKASSTSRRVLLLVLRRAWAILTDPPYPSRLASCS